MNRRAFLATTAVASAAAALPFTPAFAGELKPAPTARKLPRWRGFNLTQKVHARSEGNPPFPERDFALLEEWGFDFARLPLSYLCWATADELDNELPALSVPARLKSLLAADPDQDAKGVLRFLAHWRDRLAGVVLMLPDGRTEHAAAVVRALRA